MLRLEAGLVVIEQHAARDLLDPDEREGRHAPLRDLLDRRRQRGLRQFLGNINRSPAPSQEVAIDARERFIVEGAEHLRIQEIDLWRPH